jgi:glycosyltransferase involved in cell wall biosynthesis
MRIAVDITPLLGQRTGIGELVDGMVRALEGRPDVTVVRAALTWRGRSRAGAEHGPIPARPIQHLWTHTEFLPLTRWVGPVDVVHGTNYVVGPNGRASSRNRPVRVVSVHDLNTVHHPERCHPSTLVFPKLIQRAVATGAAVHTDSRFVEAQVRQWLGPEVNIRTVYPGVPHIGTGSNRGLPSLDAPFMLSVGTEEPRKGLESLARVFGELVHHHEDLLWVHAGSPGWGSDGLSAAIAELSASVRHRVIRLGRVDDDQRAYLLRNASVFVYPSLDEGFGFPPLEAITVGTPVVASAVGALPEVLASAAHLVEPGDEGALAIAVLEALQSSGKVVRDDMQASLFLQQFNWDRMAAELVSWYKEMLNEIAT